MRPDEANTTPNPGLCLISFGLFDHASRVLVVAQSRKLRMPEKICICPFEMPDMAGWRIKKCHAKFREHCIERHDLQENDINAWMFFDLEEFTLTLFKD